MTVEALVLGDDKRVLDDFGNLLEGRQRPAFQAEFSHEAAVYGIESRGLARLVSLEHFDGRTAVSSTHQRPRRDSESQHEGHDGGGDETGPARRSRVLLRDGDDAARYFGNAPRYPGCQWLLFGHRYPVSARNLVDMPGATGDAVVSPI